MRKVIPSVQRVKTVLQAFGLSFSCHVRQSFPISRIGYADDNYRSTALVRLRSQNLTFLKLFISQIVAHACALQRENEVAHGQLPLCSAPLSRNTTSLTNSCLKSDCIKVFMLRRQLSSLNLWKSCFCVKNIGYKSNFATENPCFHDSAVYP